MAYVAVPTKNTGDQAYSADFLNMYLKDNMASMPPDVYMAKGDLFFGTGPDAGDRVGVGPNNALLFAQSGEAVGVKWALFPNLQAHGNGSTISSETTTFTTLTNVDVENYDTAGAFANDVFTCPLTGYYLVMGRVICEATSPGDTGAYYELGIMKNGSLYSVIDSFYYGAISLTYQYIIGADIVPCVAGDTLALGRRMNNFWGGMVSVGDTGASWIEITMLPN